MSFRRQHVLILLCSALASESHVCANGGHEAACPRGDVDELNLLQSSQLVVARQVSARETVAQAPTDGTQTQTVSTEAISLPINSAGQHFGALAIVDLVLLIACLLVPFAIFAGIKTMENLAVKMSPPTAGTPPDRLGSSYDLSAGASSGAFFGAIQAFAPNSSEVDPDEGTVLSNVLAGFSTAMAALPDAISFSFITGVSPLNGIWAGVFMGLSAALVGGRPGMISSASAATAVVLADISTNPEFGMGPMALCVFIVGVLQLIAGAFRLSRFITLIPQPVMLGFVNGLAIVMIKAQMRQFHHQGDGPWVDTQTIIGMTITAVFAIVVAVGWARIPYAKNAIPGSLASVILTTVFSIAFQQWIVRRTLQDVAGAATFAGGMSTLPSWNFPPAGVSYSSGSMWGQVIATAIRFAIVGLLESLMTEALIDQITGTSSSMRRECFGQGLGNILASFFGTQGGCALIAQSLLNVGSGGRTRVSGITMGLTLAACVVILSPVMALIPVAALVGLIVLIALNTFAWSSLLLILKINFLDALVVVLVTVITVIQDLCVAVVVGVIISALGFAWTAATDVRVIEDIKEGSHHDFQLLGPLFFGSAMNYHSVVTKQKVKESVVVLNFEQSRILDHSGVDTIIKVREFWEEQGKTVRFEGITDEKVMSHLNIALANASPPESRPTPDTLPKSPPAALAATDAAADAAVAPAKK